MIELQALNHVPDLVGIHQQNPQRYPFLLSSAAVSTQARFSILFAFPQQKLTCAYQDCAEFEALLASLHVSNTAEETTLDVPFTGGWFFYFSYEYAQQVEPCLSLKHSKLPLAFAQRVPAGIVVDHYTDTAYCFCESEFNHHLDDLLSDSEAQFKALPSVTATQIDEEPDDVYLQAVIKAKQYIKDGDVFQANLSRLWRLKLNQPVTAAQCFKQLMDANPSPYAALVTLDDHYIISSSPERLIKLKQGRADTRPIAGTHPRGSSTQDDEDLAQQLLAHPKEQAEHIMLIDLERNDLGRFCQPGSIQVDELMVLESYAFVHHIVSNVSGHIKSGTSLKDVIHAVFPGGTITGCPKVRCMEIIDELEQHERNCYTGTVGYLNHDGSGDFNILIRTLLVKDDVVEFKAGAGIVADSHPEKELAETRHKAQGMLRAFS